MRFRFNAPAHHLLRFGSEDDPVLEVHGGQEFDHPGLEEYGIPPSVEAVDDEAASALADHQAAQGVSVPAGSEQSVNPGMPTADQQQEAAQNQEQATTDPTADAPVVDPQQVAGQPPAPAEVSTPTTPAGGEANVAQDSAQEGGAQS